MTPPEESLEWAARADRDLEVIATSLAAGLIVWDVLCSLSQQGAEKYLKAFLVLKSSEPPRTHNLETLLDQCLKFDSGLNGIRGECARLTPYAVVARYPFSGLTEADGRAAIAAAQRIRDEIRKRLP